MLCFRMKSAASAAVLPRHRLVLSCFLLFTCGAMLSAPVVAAKPDPEVLLLEVYKELGANRLRQAQAKADALVAAYPTFRLGHLIRGDLLQLHTKPIATFGAMRNAPQDKLKNLRDEATARLKWLHEKPDSNLMPRPILQLRDDQRQALLVDAQRSRLYVYENRNGQLKFVTDYYISQGKYGINKLKEGDQRTPVGVYYITQRVPGAKLPDFYGPGALPINYPNEWDKVNGRGGSGIWLHGTPSDSYSRPPLSSDGCVVLTNPDLQQLYQSVEAGKTPVIISERIEFVSKAKWESERNLANRLVNEWRRDIESRDPAKVIANYSPKFKSERGESVKTLLAKYQRLLAGVQKISIQIKDATFFLYPGHDNLIVGTFTQDLVIGKSRNSVRKRQYWAKESGQWKIISENNL